MKWKILVFLFVLGFSVLAQGQGEDPELPDPGNGSTSLFDQIVNSDWFSVLLGTTIVLGGYYLMSKLKVGYGGRK